MPVKPRYRILMPLLVAASLSIAAIGLSACSLFGGGSKSADQIIDDAFSGNKKVDSGKFNVGLKINATAAGGIKVPIDVKFSGAFDDVESKEAFPKLDLSLTASAAGKNFSAGLISTGDKGFVNYQGTDYEVSDQVFAMLKQSYIEQQKQTETEQKDEKGSLKSLGMDPKSWLKDLKKGPDETVAGVETNTVTGSIDIVKLLDDFGKAMEKAGALGAATQSTPFKLDEENKQKIKDAVKSITFKVNSGKDDDILRRLEIKADVVAPEESKEQLKGVEGAAITMTVEMSDLNQPQTVTAPSNPKPFEELTKKMGLGAGGLGGLGALSGGGMSNFGGGEDGSSGTTTMPEGDLGGDMPTSTTPAPNSEDMQKMMDCLKEKDAQKQSECILKIQK